MLFTGAGGTGKTWVMTKFARYLYQVETFKYKVKRLYKKQYRSLPAPALVSNYPILKRSYYTYSFRFLLFTFKVPFLSKKVYEFSDMLNKEILLLKVKLPPKSVVVCTEFGSIFDNQEYDNLNLNVNTREYLRFKRHYEKGGWFLADEQSSDDIPAVLRRKFGKLYNLMSNRPFFTLFPFSLLPIRITQVRHMSISEDIKVIEDNQAESKTKHYLMLGFVKYYDTYAFSERVASMQYANLEPYKNFKTNTLVSVPVVPRKNAYLHDYPNTINNDDLL